MPVTDTHSDPLVDSQQQSSDEEIDWTQNVEQQFHPVYSNGANDKKGSTAENSRSGKKVLATTTQDGSMEHKELLNKYGMILAHIDCKKEKAVHKCLLYYNTGVIFYRGCIKNGFRTGYGYEFNDYGIKVFEGTFDGGVRSGNGKEFDSNGRVVFSGHYSQNKREGKGKEYYPNGKLLYEGQFHQGFRHWKGIEYNENGEGKEAIYEKGIKNMRFAPSTELKEYWVETDLESGSRVLCQIDDLGKRFGIGYFYSHDDIQRVSRWKDGAEIEVMKSFSNNNKMIEYSHGIKVYEGEFENSLQRNYCRYGKGMEFLPDGRTVIFNGLYKDGKRNGTGIAYRKNVPVYHGLWVDGHRLWCVIAIHEFYVILFYGITALLFLVFDIPIVIWFIIPILLIWRRFSVIRCGVDFVLANHNYLKRHFIVGNGCCNRRHSLTIRPYLLKSIEIGDHCFRSVQTFRIDGLNRLETIKIGKNSFTQLEGSDVTFFAESLNSHSKSFHVLNCESLKSIQIGECSFCDYGGEIELKNLPQLQSIQIGDYSFSDFGGEFELKNLPQLQSIQIGDNCFKSVKTFLIDGLNRLETIKIGFDSFSKLLFLNGNDQSKSFHILNCESLKSIDIGEGSFSDFAGEFELKNLPQLQSIHIGTIRGSSYNFYNSSFVIRGIEMILNI